jgi:uncharacterized membrane protein (DUF485 family)
MSSPPKDPPPEPLFDMYPAYQDELNEVDNQIHKYRSMLNASTKFMNRLSNVASLQNTQVRIVTNDARQLSDKLTLLRRRAEQGQNEFVKRSFSLFFIQSVFVFIMVSILVALLVRNNNISQETAFALEIIIGIIITAIVLYNVYVNRYRDPMDYTSLYWTSPSVFRTSPLTPSNSTPNSESTATTSEVPTK